MEKLQHVRVQLEALEKQFEQLWVEKEELLTAVAPGQRASARNLLNYIVLRSTDIRELQDELHEAGLSSLASSESHVLGQIQSVLERLGKTYEDGQRSPNSYAYSKERISGNSEQLFGKKNGRPTYIMVTFDATFAEDIPYMESLLRGGMSVARINCAHDDERLWRKMTRNLRKACLNTGIPCKIYMDLAGPKLRTRMLGKAAKKGKLTLQKGDHFLMVEENVAYDPKEKVISCSFPGIVSKLRKGEAILFDDGEVEAKVLSVSYGLAKLEVIRNSRKNKNLKEGKGINFPESEIEIGSLTGFDKECLPFVCTHADLVGFSFVNKPEDIAELQDLLGHYEMPPHIVIKIETPEAVKALPTLFLQGMKNDVFGVMIARGDLAVEVGFERMSEVQNEILWFAEAGHIPVIWATQVLETLHKTGMATRSEITDASHASMAECVMINKGDYTLDVMDTIMDIFGRNKGHHFKKRYRMRELNIASDQLAEKAGWKIH